MNGKLLCKWYLAIPFGVMLFLVGLYFLGLKINTTGSTPIGLYKTVSGDWSKGDYVLFCPSETKVFLEGRKRGYINAGLCKGGYGLMIKKILAAKGDVVSSGVDGVFVNGEKLISSTPKVRDGNGNPMQIFKAEKVVLDEQQVLLMSDSSENSFDARYFGLVNKSQIKSKIQPLFNW